MNKIKILPIDFTMELENVVTDVAFGSLRELENVSVEEISESSRPVAYITLTYPENPDWDNPIKEAENRGLQYCWIIHNRDVREDGTPDKDHCQCLIRLKDGMSKEAFCANFGIGPRWVQPLKSYKGFAVYMVHADKNSRDAGKYQYSTDDLQGPLASDITKIIQSKISGKQSGKADDDSNILRILDWIESMDYISTSALVRWCCENGLYSCFRRAGNIVMSVLREHNNICTSDVVQTIYEIKLQEMEKRLSEAEKEIESHYQDLYHRIENPFTGTVTEKYRGVDMVTVRELLKGG